MATIINQTDDGLLNDDEVFSDLDSLTESPAVDEATADTTEDKDDEVVTPVVPAKFQGKSIDDVIHSYTELEKEYGRRSNEVGELRRMTDDILRQSLQVDKTETVDSKTEVDDLLDNPDKVIENAVSNSPRLQALENRLLQADRDAAKLKFESDFPTAYETVKDKGFQDWVDASSVRKAMFLDAHTNYKYDVAGELINLYGNVVSADTSAEDERKAKRDQALKDAGTEKGTSGQSSKKVYRRSDLLKMMRSNSKGYNDPAFQAALAVAYSEGRVR